MSNGMITVEIDPTAVSGVKRLLREESDEVTVRAALAIAKRILDGADRGETLLVERPDGSMSKLTLTKNGRAV